MIQLTLWSISPLLAALVAVGAYLRMSRKQRVPGTPAVLAMLATVMFWSGCQFLESLFTQLGPKLLVLKLSYPAITLAPVLWMLFVVSYVQRRTRLSRGLQNLLAIVPLITIALAISNDWHHLMWLDATVVDANGFAALVTERGPWFYVNAAYSYGLIVVATTILAYVLSSTTREVKPVLGVVLAPLVVAGANLFYLSPWNPVPWFDCTTLGLVAAALILDASVLRHGVLDNIPVLRDRVLEQLTEGVVVVDVGGRIVDVNLAALALLGTHRRHAVRGPVTALLPMLSIETLIDGPLDSLEVVVHGRCYDVTGLRLDSADPASNVVLAFRDVTVRRDTELALRSAQQELHRLAHTDPLTGLYNRRLFMDRLNQEIQRLRRHPGCLSVVILDLDYFKEVNDRHGHDAGDRVLGAVAEQILAVKRGSDVVARVGGEEFALLLPDTDASGAHHLAQRVRGAIEAIDVTTVIGVHQPVTASIGLATVTGGVDDPGHVLKRADDALYRAKNGGRNQVCTAT
jgi:diguanylate cyclase (GGDEF)-like protein